MEQSLVPERRPLPGRSIPTVCPVPNSQPWKYTHTGCIILTQYVILRNRYASVDTQTITISDEKRPWFWRRVEGYIWENYEGGKEGRNVAYKL